MRSVFGPATSRSSWAIRVYPFAFPAASSSGARSVGPAVHAAALAARKKVAKLAVKDRESALFGVDADSLQASSGGRLALSGRSEPVRHLSPTCCSAMALASTSRNTRETRTISTGRCTDR